MTSPRPINPRDPVTELLELAGVSGIEASRRMGKARNHANKAKARGASVQLASLLELADVLDLELAIYATPRTALALELWCGECGRTWSHASGPWVCPACGETDELERTEAQPKPRKDTRS